MEPLGSHEGPAAYVHRTGLGIDRAWKIWNAWMLANERPTMSRTQFRLEARSGAEKVRA